MRVRFLEFSRTPFTFAIVLVLLAETPEALYAHELSNQDAHSASSLPPPTTLATQSPTPFRTDWYSVVSAPDPEERSVEEAGPEDGTNLVTSSCADGNKEACLDPFGDDEEARRQFEDRIGGIIKELLAAEMEGFIKDVSGRALNALTAELLSLTLNGEQYLCLNLVRHQAPGPAPAPAPAPALVLLLMPSKDESV